MQHKNIIDKLLIIIDGLASIDNFYDLQCHEYTGD